jgi:DNA-binding SARP family transcriptional activator
MLPGHVAATWGRVTEMLFGSTISYRLDFRVLGPLEARVNGRAVRLGTPKQRKLLALLVLRANRVVTWSSAWEELWGDWPPDSAAANLRSYASGLRALLPADLADRLVTLPTGYLLRAEGGEVDVGRFGVLAADGGAALDQGDPYRAVLLLSQALALWRGDPIEDVPAGPVLVPIQAALREQLLGARESYAAARLASGEAASVIADLRDLLNGHPCRERGWALLMAAQYQVGDVAGALQSFLSARGALREHLGIEPGHQLRRLQHVILTRTAELP